MTTSKSPFDLSQTKRFGYGLSNTPRTDFNQINNLKRDLVNQTPKPEMFYQNTIPSHATFTPIKNSFTPQSPIQPPQSQIRPIQIQPKIFQISPREFPIDKLFNYRDITKPILINLQITIPFLIFLLYLYRLFMTKAIYSYLLPISVIFFPLITHFLLSSIISEKKKYISQIENLPLEKTITFFYTGLVPFFIFSILTFVIHVKSFVGTLTLICSIVYSASLSMKYLIVYISTDYNRIFVENDCILFFMIFAIFYSYFGLFLVK